MNTGKNEGGSGKKFLTVLSDGRFHQTVPEGTPGSVERTYEDKEGVEQKKIELVTDYVTGKITKMSFETGDFGTNLNVELDGDGVISMSTSSNFGEDLMKKIPNIDLEKEVKIVPYAFEDDQKKMRKGVTVYQDGEKVLSFYTDEATKKSINGIPEPDGDTTSFSSDDWKVYFITVRKFLVKEVEKIINSMNTF